MFTAALDFLARNETRILRAFSIIGIVIVCGFMLMGCATFDYEWRQTRPASFKPWLYVTVDDPDATCRHIGTDTEGRSGRIQACAEWAPSGCLIFISKDAPAWLIAHEERHCAGWTH